jgi:hypothetical protein
MAAVPLGLIMAALCAVYLSSQPFPSPVVIRILDAFNASSEIEAIINGVSAFAIDLLDSYNNAAYSNALDAPPDEKQYKGILEFSIKNLRSLSIFCLSAHSSASLILNRLL